MSRQPRTVRERIETIALVLVFLPLILPLVVIALVLFATHRVVLYMLVWMLWVPMGKDTLFVYSNSPIWHDYMMRQVLPLVDDRAIVLNWSERSTWRKWRLTQQIFYSFGGHREFNPMVIVFRPFLPCQAIPVLVGFQGLKTWQYRPCGAAEKRVATEPVISVRGCRRNGDTRS